VSISLQITTNGKNYKWRGSGPHKKLEGIGVRVKRVCVKRV